MKYLMIKREWVKGRKWSRLLSVGRDYKDKFSTNRKFQNFLFSSRGLFEFFLYLNFIYLKSRSNFN